MGSIVSCVVPFVMIATGPGPTVSLQHFPSADVNPSRSSAITQAAIPLVALAPPLNRRFTSVTHHLN